MVEYPEVRFIDSYHHEALLNEVGYLLSYGVDVGFDLETTGTDPINSKIVTMAFKPKGKRAVVFDVRHWDRASFLAFGYMLEPLFDGSVTLVGHNIKFDMEFMFAQLRLAGHRVYDTMLADQLILGLGVSSAAEKGIHFDMHSVAERYGLSVHKEERSYFIHMDRERGKWYSSLPPAQLNYIRQDVSTVHRIKEIQAPLIEQVGLGEVVELENRALFALAGIEVYGVQINREGWLSVIDRVQARANELERTLHLGVEGPEGYEGLDVHVLKVRQDRYMDKWLPYQEWMKARDAFVATRKADYERGWVQGYKNRSEYKKVSLDWWYEGHGKLTKPPANKAGVNLGSWMQVRDGFNDLFESLGQNATLTSVSEEDLDPLRHLHPLVGVYIEYSHARKIVTVYGREKGKKGKAFIDLLDDSDRLRASYQQIGADTGRMSSHSPNFQQIPTEGMGAELRKNIVAAPGYTLVVADFSNIELRIVAELSGDKFLLDAFASGEDVHAYTAKVMFNLEIPEGVSAKKWTSQDATVNGRKLEGTSYRKIAKTINYALLYGAGPDRLASVLSVDLPTAKLLHGTYYSTFEQAIAWLNERRSGLDRARKRGEKRVYAETRSGRKRWFDMPELHLPKYPTNGSRLTVEAVQRWQEEAEEAKTLHRKKLGSIRRQLANTPVQGLSADITKEAAAGWYEWVGYDDDMRLVGVVHDELIAEVRPERVEEAKGGLRTVMMAAMQKYLHVVDLGEVDPVETPYWMH